MIKRVIVMFAMIVLAACAPATNQRSGSSRDVLTRADIAATSSPNIYDLITLTRSHWFRGVSSTTATPVVYVDGREFGPVETLRSMATNTAERVQFYSATEAQSRFGMAYARPIIEVTTRGR